MSSLPYVQPRCLLSYPRPTVLLSVLFSANHPTCGEPTLTSFLGFTVDIPPFTVDHHLSILFMSPSIVHLCPRPPNFAFSVSPLKFLITLFSLKMRGEFEQRGSKKPVMDPPIDLEKFISPILEKLY